MGVDWVWQVSKYIVQLSPRDPCRAVIWYRGFEAWAVHNVMSGRNRLVSGHTAERVLRRLAQGGYLIQAGLRAHCGEGAQEAGPGGLPDKGGEGPVCSVSAIP